MSWACPYQDAGYVYHIGGNSSGVARAAHAPDLNEYVRGGGAVDGRNELFHDGHLQWYVNGTDLFYHNGGGGNAPGYLQTYDER